MKEIDISLFQIFYIHQNVIQIFNNKDIICFSESFINLFFKASLNIIQAKKHYLIFKITILSPKTSLLFIFFLDFYTMICTYKLELGKLFSLSPLIKQIANQK